MRGVIRGHEPNETFWIDGQQVTKAQFDEIFPDVPLGDGTGLIGWRPIISDGLAVHPAQVQEAIDDAKRKGVPTEFLPDGRPVLRSRQHRAEYLRRYGFYDRDAGYGDPAKGTFKDIPDQPKPDVVDY